MYAAVSGLANLIRSQERIQGLPTTKEIAIIYEQARRALETFRSIHAFPRMETL